MPCEVRGNMIICRRPDRNPKPCQHPECSLPGVFLCDYQTGVGTCDRRFCVRHGKRLASETDYCWEHVVTIETYQGVTHGS